MLLVDHVDDLNNTLHCSHPFEKSAFLAIRNDWPRLHDGQMSVTGLAPIKGFRWAHPSLLDGPVHFKMRTSRCHLPNCLCIPSRPGQEPHKASHVNRNPRYWALRIDLAVLSNWSVHHVDGSHRVHTHPNRLTSPSRAQASSRKRQWCGNYCHRDWGTSMYYLFSCKLQG